MVSVPTIALDLKLELMIRNKALIYTEFKQGAPAVANSREQMASLAAPGERGAHKTRISAAQGGPAAANPLSCRVHTTLGVRDD